MKIPIPITGSGVVRAPGAGSDARKEFSLRLSAAVESLASKGRRIRLIHGIEEAAFLAAVDAFRSAGKDSGDARDRTGIALGVDEGIDGIKAAHCLGVARDGPSGASPLHFPFTAPNAVAAQISIVMDLRGESITYSGGTLCSARALGHALQALRAGLASAMLAGGVTSVEQGLPGAALRAGGACEAPHPLDAACLFLLESPRTARRPTEGEARHLLGFAEGFGDHGARDAILHCLEDAATFPADLGAAWIAAGGDDRILTEAAREAGISLPLVRSPQFSADAAAFPSAISAALDRRTKRSATPVLIAGTDLWGGSVAVIAR